MWTELWSHHAVCGCLDCTQLLFLIRVFERSLWEVGGWFRVLSASSMCTWALALHQPLYSGGQLRVAASLTFIQNTSLKKVLRLIIFVMGRKSTLLGKIHPLARGGRGSSLLTPNRSDQHPTLKRITSALVLKAGRVQFHVSLSTPSPYVSEALGLGEL